MKRVRVHLAHLLILIDRAFAPACPYCLQRTDTCWCRGHDWLP